jgi:hypothetical protein
MVEVDAVAIVQCEGCTWWWFFYDQRPTIPFICELCKLGCPAWEPRVPTPAYGSIRRRQQTIPFGLEEVTRPMSVPPELKRPKKKPKKKRSV